MQKKLFIIILIIGITCIALAGFYFRKFNVKEKDIKWTNMEKSQDFEQNISANNLQDKSSLENLRERFENYRQAVSKGDFATAYEMEDPKQREVGLYISKDEYIKLGKSREKDIEKTKQTLISSSIGKISIEKAATKEDPTIIAKIEIIYNIADEKGKITALKGKTLWCYVKDNWYHLFE